MMRRLKGKQMNKVCDNNIYSTFIQFKNYDKCLKLYVDQRILTLRDTYCKNQ